MSRGPSTGVARLRTVLFGSGDQRVRACWRVLLAWPLLPLVGVGVALVTPLLGVSGMIPAGPLQGILFAGVLLVWSRYIDRRPLTDYGVVATRSWLSRVLVGFAVVVVVWSGWHVLATSRGWMQIGWAATAPETVVGAAVSLVVNTWVQDVVFFAIVLKAAAEGLHNRGVEPYRAVLGGWVVSIGFFTVIHEQTTLLDATNSVVTAAVFGLLYLHTADLGLTIGVHWGSSYAAGVLFPTQSGLGPSVFVVSEALSWAKGGLTPIYLYLATYLVIVGGLHAFRGEIGIETGLAEWTDRRHNHSGRDSPLHDS